MNDRQSDDGARNWADVHARLEAIDYSQGGEQRVILQVARDSLDRINTPDAPVFIDIGAHDGWTFSNSAALRRLQWGGACVEPAPVPFSKLLTHLADAPNVIAVPAALAERDEPIEFYDCDGDMAGTTLPSHRDKWQGQHCMNRTSTVRFRPVPIMSMGITWDTLLTMMTAKGLCPSLVEVVSIDIEGNSLWALRAMPLDRLPRLRCVVVEKDDPDDSRLSVLVWMATSGFEVVMETAENVVGVRAPTGSGL